MPTYDFNGPDSATSLGSDWTADSGTWGIDGNAGYLATPAGVEPNVATVPSQADGTFKTNLSVLDGMFSGGVAFRFSGGGTDGWAFVRNTADWSLRQMAGGAGSAVTGAPTALTGELSVVALADAIECFIGGVSVVSLTDSFNQTANRAGLLSESALNNTRWDDFTCPDVPGGGDDASMFFTL